VATGDTTASIQAARFQNWHHKINVMMWCLGSLGVEGLDNFFHNQIMLTVTSSILRPLDYDYCTAYARLLAMRLFIMYKRVDDDDVILVLLAPSCNRRKRPAAVAVAVAQ
jgi:hypothetical protein